MTGRPTSTRRRPTRSATRRQRALVVTVVFALCAPLMACGPEAKSGFAYLPRSYDAPDRPDGSFAPAMVFVPGAAYVVGLRDDATYREGRWAAGTAPQWPEETGAPTLALGRVVERRPSWARLELLGAVDSMRAGDLEPRELGVDEPLPSLTKRILVVTGTLESPTVPIGNSHLVTGHERYGVLPGRPDAGRLSSHLRGVARLEAVDAQNSRLEAVQGRAPRPGDLLVLLGVAPEAVLRVRVYIADAVDEPRDVVDAFERGTQRLRIDDLTTTKVPRPTSHEEIIMRLAGKAEDSLSIIIYRLSEPDGWYMLSQADRVDDLPPAMPVFLGATLHEPAVNAVLAHALLMRGESARALVTLEQVLASSSQPADWVRLSVPLARAMTASWRSDWSMEVALALDTLAAEGDVEALQALVQVDQSRHPTARQATIDQLDGARQEGAVLHPSTLTAVVDFLQRQQRTNEATSWLQSVGQTDGSDPHTAAFLLAWLELRGQAMRGDRVSAEAQEEAYVAASGLGLRYELAVSAEVVLAELEATRTVSTPLLDEVRRADELGAPAVALRLLARAAEVAAEGENGLLADRLMLEAARFARAARRPRNIATVLYELERYRLSRGRSALEGELVAPYVDALASADLRLWLGRRSLAAAQQAGDTQSARDALELALELFGSIGDGANVAITCLGLARQDASMRRLDEAKAWVARARLFEGVLKDPSLTAFRQQVEREIAQRERFDEATSP